MVSDIQAGDGKSANSFLQCMALSASGAAVVVVPSFNALMVGGQACLFLYTVQPHSEQLLLLKVCKTNLHTYVQPPILA